MSTPVKTSLDAIVLAARELLEAEGLAGLTMQAVAERVGVRAPSLYKRVASRDDLIRLVTEATLVELGDRLSGETTVLGLVSGFRAFAHERPVTYLVLMAPNPNIPKPGLEFRLAASDPIIRAMADLAGEEHALDAARTLTAWANGFISMELTDGFGLGGDVEAAWAYGASKLVDAIRA